jgi:hypothetical protein
MRMQEATPMDTLTNVGTMAFTPVYLPGSFNAVSSTVTAINDAGVITGFYTDTGAATHGFVDKSGTFSSFDDPSGTNTMFFGINASDQIVGSFLAGSGETNGLLFNYLTDSFQTENYPLASGTPAFGVTGTTINGINNAGDLVGFYSDGTNVNGLLALRRPNQQCSGCS